MNSNNIYIDPMNIPIATVVGVPYNDDGTEEYPLPPPMSPPTSSSFLNRPRKEITSRDIMELKQQGFTAGLARALSDNTETFPLRIWVIDNSGSMMMNDGNRIVQTKSKDKVKLIQCTRWKEIQETVRYHAQLSGLLECPTQFRMLNPPNPNVGPPLFKIAHQSLKPIPEQVREAMNVISNEVPYGVTPLTRHILEIRDYITAELLPTLLQCRQRVAIIIATDGTPTNERGTGGEFEQSEFVSALRSLEGLPVWVVIRLCTDDDDVVDFYNEIDAQLEMSIEVLDDFQSEAKEVYGKNPWLNYTLSLHRCREMGFHNKLFDLLDERPLTKGELLDFCGLVFGAEDINGIPDPDEEWSEFVFALKRVMQKEDLNWNPNTKTVGPWIDVAKLNSIYNDEGGGCQIM